MALLVAGCDFGSKPKAPTGQVVANVGGREITARELRAEISTAAPVAPAAQKDQQRAALEFIIERTALAEEARKQGIDKDPDFILLNQRATDTLLVQRLQAKIAAAVPAPTAEEASRFEAENPNIFAERKIFEVEQVRMEQQTDRSLLAKLQPLKTLDEVTALLGQNHVNFQRGTSAIDAAAQSPQLVNAIVALPPQEVFVFPAGNQILINQVKSVRTEPFTGPVADKYAMDLVKLQRTQIAVQRLMAQVLQKAKASTQVAKEYQQTKPAAAPAKPAAKTGG